MKIKASTLLACFIIVAIVAFLGSIFTSAEVNSRWYMSVKPAITPPNSVFIIVWSTLFFLIAISLYFAWTTSKDKKLIGILFAVNLLLNLLWSILFFKLKNPFYAFIDLILMWGSILVLVILTWKFDKKSSILLWPYLAWVAFAGVLNYLIIANPLQ